MEQPRLTAAPPVSAPRFYLTGRQPLRPEAILLAVVVAVGAISLISVGLGKTGHRHFAEGEPTAARTSSSAAGAKPTEEKEDDDPSQVDTIVLGDPADAPVPARRTNHGPTSVHATILIHLPRYGEQAGLIPDTPAGHLLYRWLAAFNQTSSRALEDILPNGSPSSSTAAQMVLRFQTGGFNLLSAKEVQPGVLVFRLRDQTPLGKEALGTLQVRPNSNPPEIASFSIRGIP